MTEWLGLIEERSTLALPENADETTVGASKRGLALTCMPVRTRPKPVRAQIARAQPAVAVRVMSAVKIVAVAWVREMSAMEIEIVDLEMIPAGHVVTARHLQIDY